MAKIDDDLIKRAKEQSAARAAENEILLKRVDLLEKKVKALEDWLDANLIAHHKIK